ncbi:MAG: helix-turn-helix domain-containing protein [Deltaproteobacteria bacterium]|jgi:transposase|nr:helix-turn-helix domain-containing protein [Deltaproteobacteria bacterium]
MEKKYIVTLKVTEVNELTEILNKGKHPAQKRKRAHALLLAHEGEKSDREIAKIVRMNDQSVTDLRKRFSLHGFAMALTGKPHNRRPRVIAHEDEARLLALASKERQEGKPPCSLRTLARKFVTSDGRRVSHETIRQVLKKFDLAKPLPRQGWSGTESTL